MPRPRTNPHSPGAFTGIGAYVTVLLWNNAGLSPLIGIPIAVVIAALLAELVGYPCFRQRITGHYFALVTLALTEFVRLVIVGLRDLTGSSLGTQPKRYGDGVSLYAVQFEPDRTLAYFVAIVIWVIGLYIWWRVDRSMDRYALDTAIYGLLLILFIIYMPKGILGTAIDWWERHKSRWRLRHDAFWPVDVWPVETSEQLKRQGWTTTCSPGAKACTASA